MSAGPPCQVGLLVSRLGDAGLIGPELDTLVLKVVVGIGATAAGLGGEVAHHVGEAAVDLDGVAGGEVRARGRQEHDGVGDIADPTSAAAVALGGVVVSVNTCANLVGRLSFGQIIDKLGAYKSLLISLVVTIVALVIMSMSFTQAMFFVALALLGFSFGALLVIYPPLTGGAFGTSNIGVNYGIMFLGYAASTWISQPITAVLYHAEAGSAAYQQSFYGAIVIAAIAVVLTVYMMVSDSKKKSA